MPEIIDTIRFMEYGKPAPNNSEFKGLVTTDTVFGSKEDGSYFSYTSRLNATESSFNDQITVNEDGFIGYTSRENAAGATTYSSIGVLDKEKIETFRKMGRKAFSKKGDLLWDAVIALDSFESAHKHNLFHTADYAAAISKVLPQFFKKVGLDPENMIWWMNYHQNTDHPHMHVCFLEKIHTRSKGKFTPKQLKEFKRLIIKELTARDTISELTGSSYDVVFKKKDAERNALLERIRSLNIEGIDSIVKLATVLPKLGRLQYNSANLGAYRKQIDEITEQKQFLYITLVSLLCNALEVFFVWIFMRFYKNAFSTIKVPTRYIILFAISLVIVVTQGSLLLYFNNSDFTVSAGTMILLTIVYELFLGAAFYEMMHESFLRKRIRQVPVFSVAIERLNDQLQFLEQQKALIQTAETKLHEYKQKADLSESINPVFDAANAYIENLYTDNPVINTLLMYYTSLYDRTGVQYSFELGTSTYTPISDSLMIYIFSSLLDAAEQFFTLRFSRSANLYTVYACTGGRISDAQYLMLESLPSLSTDIDITCSTEKDDARKSVEIRFLVK